LAYKSGRFNGINYLSSSGNKNEERPIRLWCVLNYLFLLFIIPSGVRLFSLGTAATTGLQYQPQMIDDDDCGAIGGMKIDRGNLSTGRKPAQAPLLSTTNHT
jgi:hypothetical protein